MTPFLLVLGAMLLAALLMLAKSLHVVPEEQRVVLLRLGAFLGVRGPGLVFAIPAIDRLVRYSVLPQEQRLSPEPRTEESQQIQGVVRYRILDPEKAYRNCESPGEAIQLAARAAIQQAAERRPGSPLADVFSRQALRDLLNERCASFGVEILDVEPAPSRA